MPDNDPLADIFTLFAAPIAGTVRSVEQFRTGVDEFLRGVENFNRTMANLNETTERINSLLADVEEPIRAAVPQFTRSVKAADELMKVVSGPAMAAAPALNQIADTIGTPAFQQLPARVAQFNEMMTEMSRRLGPLTQLAETAGGLFGGFRFPGTSPSAVANTAERIHDDLDDEADDDELDDTELDDSEVDDEPEDTALGSEVDDEVDEPAEEVDETPVPAKSSPARKKTAERASSGKKRTTAGKKTTANKKTAPKKTAPSKKTAASNKTAASKKKATRKTSSRTSSAVDPPGDYLD